MPAPSDPLPCAVADDDEDVEEVDWKRMGWRFGTRRASLLWDSGSLAADLEEIILGDMNLQWS